MGEPGTKEPLSLEELQAATNLRTGRKHVLSILVEDKAGVLTRIAGLFARRGFNIDTLTVGPTEDARISPLTLTLAGAVHAHGRPARGRADLARDAHRRRCGPPDRPGDKAAAQARQRAEDPRPRAVGD